MKKFANDYLTVTTFNHIQRVFATFYYLRYNLDNRRNLNEYTKILGRIRVKR